MDIWELGLRVRRVEDALKVELGSRVTDAMVQDITPFRYHQHVTLPDDSQIPHDPTWPHTPDVLSEDE
ncbi:MAG TPA: hypothetical protein VG992_02230 [Candidatus Saccharimonadales bacterium]|nr:hypothetical protein [Candidatus Saccharimonadales bacterium]